MKSKNLAIILIGSLIWSALPSASALTAQERKIVEAAQAQIEIAMQDYAATKTALALAQQAAADADAHAAQTDKNLVDLNKQIEDAYKREKALASDNAKMKPVYEEVNRYWGIGAILYGVKKLSEHLLVLGILLALGGVAIYFFAPGLLIVLRAIGRFLGAGFSAGLQILTAVILKIGSLFKSKPGPPPASSAS